MCIRDRLNTVRGLLREFGIVIPVGAQHVVPTVHALTDVTGFGLLGHLVEICKASRVSAVIDYAALPVLPQAFEYAEKGCITGASERNWASYGDYVARPTKHLADIDQALLTDPQTSGGLLIACAPEVVTEVLSIFLQEGFDHATVIGEVAAGKAQVSVVKGKSGG